MPWRILEPPKTLHDVPDRAALDALIARHQHEYDRHCTYLDLTHAL